MGWFDSLTAPHSWLTSQQQMPQFSHGGMRDNADMRMQGFAEHALHPNFRGQGHFYQLWQQMQAPQAYAPPEAPPQYQPPNMGFNPPMSPPKPGYDPNQGMMQPMGVPPPGKWGRVPR